MKKQLLFLFVIFWCIGIQAQQIEPWTRVQSPLVTGKSVANSSSERIHYKLNEVFFKQKLATATGKPSGVTTEITIPNAAGVTERFLVYESSNFDPALQAKFPEIRAYAGYGIDDPTAKIHFSLAPSGIQTMVFRANGLLEFIEKNVENKLEYVWFTSKSSNRTANQFTCKTPAVRAEKINTNKTSTTTSDTQVLKTLRLALSCTGEYAAYFGGTKAGAMAGMNATMTRVNGIFNRDLAVRLELIGNNDDVIYTDPASDPYANADVGANGQWNLQVQQTLTTVLGNSAYDIGHLFGASGGGGDAGCIGCVCVNPATFLDRNAKGSAFTSPADNIPEGDDFDIDFVAHEMGHQLGASHTFSYDTEGTGVNVEPGSGSTIMGYAGVTEDYDIQNNSDDYFAYVSIAEIQNNLATKLCPVSTPIVNNPPVINAGADYIIPFSTPFILTGSGSDADGNTILYSWEQNDSAITTTFSKSIAYPEKPDGPLFRSQIPSAVPVRYMPELSSVVQNRLSTKWESVSSVGRTLNFTLTGRDNVLTGGQTGTDAMVVTVNPAIGPFAVSSQNTPDIGWQSGSAQTITWEVNNTTNLPGADNVRIKLSTDGGITFPVTLAASTPNDGSHTIVVPEGISSTNCRLMIQPVNNIFYALNKTAFAIGYSSETTCDTYSFGNSFSITFSAAFTTKTVNVPSSPGVVSDVNVAVNFTHSRMSDVEIEIQSPQGTIVKLFNRGCNYTNGNLDLEFDDLGVALDCGLSARQVVFPEDLLSSFNGENSEGNWTFRVRDAVSGSFGTINSASITICNQTFTLGVPQAEKMDFIVYPNPSEGNFTVQFESDSIHQPKIEVYNILGERVYRKEFAKTFHFNENIQLPRRASGLYLISVQEGDRKFVKKILVQ
jgi:subtilisin-like proprotein convertase family protein